MTKIETRNSRVDERLLMVFHLITCNVSAAAHWVNVNDGRPTADDNERLGIGKDAHAKQLKTFTRPEEVDSRAVSIWERYLDLRVSIGEPLSNNGGAHLCQGETHRCG
jgi:hypothetical protein